VDVARQEHHADAVVARRGQLDARLLRLRAQEVVGNLHQHAGAVAGERIAAAGAAMGEVAHHLEALLDDAVRLGALHVDHEADAAGVVLVSRIPEPPVLRVAMLILSVRCRSPFRARRTRLPPTGGYVG
jgi:hypothetical protein